MLFDSQEPPFVTVSTSGQSGYAFVQTQRCMVSYALVLVPREENGGQPDLEDADRLASLFVAAASITWSLAKTERSALGAKDIGTSELYELSPGNFKKLVETIKNERSKTASTDDEEN